jgi:Ni/Fe-hydrogenase subunit HybB-like protein
MAFLVTVGVIAVFSLLLMVIASTLALLSDRINPR